MALDPAQQFLFNLVKDLEQKDIEEFTEFRDIVLDLVKASKALNEFDSRDANRHLDHAVTILAEAHNRALAIVRRCTVLIEFLNDKNHMHKLEEDEKRLLRLASGLPTHVKQVDQELRDLIKFINTHVLLFEEDELMQKFASAERQVKGMMTVMRTMFILERRFMVY